MLSVAQKGDFRSSINGSHLAHREANTEIDVLGGLGQVHDGLHFEVEHADVFAVDALHFQGRCHVAFHFSAYELGLKAHHGLRLVGLIDFELSVGVKALSVPANHAKHKLFLCERQRLHEELESVPLVLPDVRPLVLSVLSLKAS